MNDDTKQFVELGKELPAVDLDATTAEMIARRARLDLGKGPPPGRLVLPIVAGVVTISYAVWTLLKLIEVLG